MSVRYQTVTEMRAAATSGFSTNISHTAYVDALADFFKFVPGSTTPDVSNIVISSNDALGKWHRMGIPPQTAAGAILRYDASGNAAAYSPVAAGRVLTDNGPGLPPSWQTPQLIALDAGTALTNATGYTSPTFTNGGYQKLILEVDGFESSAAFDPVLNLTGLSSLTAGAASLTYQNSVPALAVFDSTTTMFAAILDSAGGNIRVHGTVTIHPLVTGNVRHYFADWHSTGVIRKCSGSGQCTDTTNGITAVGWTGSTSFTGTAKLFGLKAVL